MAISKVAIMAEEMGVQDVSGPPERSGGGPEGVQRPNPEVIEKPTRRRFSAKYKLSLLEKADKCIQPGEIGELLRREGVYWSCFARWRKQRELGTLQGLKEQKRGRKPLMDKTSAKKLAQLERENRRLKRKLEQAEILIDIQKKASKLLGIELARPLNEEDD